MSVMIITHSADYDGHFSGAIAHRAYSGADVVGWDYGQPVPVVPDYITDIYMLDICIPELMNDPRLIWIDHHKSSIDEFDHLGMLGVRTIGVAACELAWNYFNSTMTVIPLAVQLASVYDVFNRQSPLWEDAQNFQFGLRACGYKTLDDVTANFDTICEDVVRIVGKGKPIRQWEIESATNYARSMHHVIKYRGHKIAAVNSNVRGSGAFGTFLDEENDFDFSMAYRYDPNVGKVRFGIYHINGKEDIDLSVIAQDFGGGGHKGASGFEMSVEDYATFMYCWGSGVKGGDNV